MQRTPTDHQAISDDSRYLPEMPEDRSVPIGCIGSGFAMADCHLVAYRQAGFNPTAIASRNVATAKQVAARHSIPSVHGDHRRLLEDRRIQVIDIAVPPDVQSRVIEDAICHPHIRGILAQKPLAPSYAEGQRLVRLCESAGVTLCVNQNMRYDQSIRFCKSLLRSGELGEPVLATIDMRAIPHWMPWQSRQGWMTCRIMSIHHLDTMRYWFGNPRRVFASFRTDPRTQFAHADGIGLYILEYDSGLRCMICDDVWAGPAREGAAADLGIWYRVEGTKGLARGTIGWPSYPERTPSTIDYSTIDNAAIASGAAIGYSVWRQPRWNEVWFPDAFAGPMAELLVALQRGEQPSMSGADNLLTLALVDACYESAAQHRGIDISEVADASASSQPGA